MKLPSPDHSPRCPELSARSHWLAPVSVSVSTLRLVCVCVRINERRVHAVIGIECQTYTLIYGFLRFTVWLINRCSLRAARRRTSRGPFPIRLGSRVRLFTAAAAAGLARPFSPLLKMQNTPSHSVRAQIRGCSPARRPSRDWLLKTRKDRRYTTRRVSCIRSKPP